MGKGVAGMMKRTTEKNKMDVKNVYLGVSRTDEKDDRVG